MTATGCQRQQGGCLGREGGRCVCGRMYDEAMLTGRRGRLGVVAVAIAGVIKITTLRFARNRVTLFHLRFTRARSFKRTRRNALPMRQDGEIGRSKRDNALRVESTRTRPARYRTSPSIATCDASSPQWRPPLATVHIQAPIHSCAQPSCIPRQASSDQIRLGDGNVFDSSMVIWRLSGDALYRWLHDSCEA